MTVRRLTFGQTAGVAGPPGTPPADTVIYAIGDIHGRCDLLAALQRGIGLDAMRRSTRRRVVIYLGDYISRGIDSRRVLDQVVGWRPAGFEIVTLKGNHEDLLLRFLDGDLRVGRHWLVFGGGLEMLVHYGVGSGESAVHDDQALGALRRRLLEAMPEAHTRLLRRLATQHRENGYLFVHAGIRPGVALDAQRERDLMWIRNRFLRSENDHGAVIVHGHCISPAPQVRHNRIGIDTGAYRTGVLTCLILDGAEGAFLQSGDGAARASPRSAAHVPARDRSARASPLRTHRTHVRQRGPTHHRARGPQRSTRPDEPLKPTDTT